MGKTTPGKRFRNYDFTPGDWAALCDRYANQCARCGAGGKMTVDHIVPRAAGGTDSLDNIQPLCRSCNSKKGSIHAGERKHWRADSPGRRAVTMSLTRDARVILEVAGTKYGVGNYAVVEMALREFAASRSIDYTAPKES